MIEAFKDAIGIVDDAGDITERLHNITKKELVVLAKAKEGMSRIKSRLSGIKTKKKLDRGEYGKISSVLKNIGADTRVVHRDLKTFSSIEDRFENEYDKLTSKIESSSFPKSERSKAMENLKKAKVKFNAAKVKFNSTIKIVDDLRASVNKAMTDWKLVGAGVAIITLSLVNYWWVRDIAKQAKKGEEAMAVILLLFGGLVELFLAAKYVVKGIGKGVAAGMRGSHDVMVAAAHKLGIGDA